jgi:hypothetical protein
MMSVATASSTPRDFGGYRRIHLFEGLWRSLVGEHSGYILRPRRGKDRGRLQQYPFGSVLDDEACARLPTPPLRKEPSN